jgi:hypothetical protein
MPLCNAHASARTGPDFKWSNSQTAKHVALSGHPWRELNSQPGQITPMGLKPAARIPLESYPVTKV